MKKKLIALLALLLCATLSHAFAETVVIDRINDCFIDITVDGQEYAVCLKK